MTLRIQPISNRKFDLHALSLPGGPNFENCVFHAAWKTPRSGAVGAVLINLENQRLYAVVLRRGLDHRFIITRKTDRCTSVNEASAAVATAMRPEDLPEALPSGEKCRRELFVTGKKSVGESFKLLTSTQSYFPAPMTLGEVYFAMQNLGQNFVFKINTCSREERLND